MSDGSQQRTSGFCIYIDTFFQGPVPTVFDEHDKLCIFATEAEAQREIADNAMTRLEQFLSGERDFDDAMMACSPKVDPGAMRDWRRESAAELSL